MNINYFAALLAKATTEKKAQQLLNRYLGGFKFRRYAFTYYSGHVKSGRKLRYHHVSVALQPWHTHYLEQNYADVDRTLEDIHLSTLPLFWDVQEQLLQAKNRREHRIRLDSIEYGIDQGLSLPVHGPHHDFATLTLHQFRDENCLKDYEVHQFEWWSAAAIFYDHIKRILNFDKAPVDPFRLTRRETQCLVLTEKLMRVEQIAKALNISVSTVNFHLQNANKKLGTNNKYQAIYKYFS